MRRLVPAVLVAGFVLVACAAGPSTLTVVTGASSKTAAARTARVWVETRITPGPSARVSLPQDVTGQGSFDLVTRQGELTSNAGGQVADVVLDGTTVYENLPQLAHRLGGRPWIKLDLNALAQAAGISGMGNLGPSGSSDPTQALEQLRGASGPITTVGKERVRGVETTHYHAVVDLTKAASLAPPDQRATIEQVRDRLGITSVPVDVWIDAQGRARRIHETVDYSSAKPLPNLPAGSLPASVDTTVELFDFGIPVSVVVPPPDEVTDLGQILAQLRASQTAGQ